MSEDLEELLALSDRLAVIHQGRIMGITEDPRALSEEDLGLSWRELLLWRDVLRGREERGRRSSSDRFVIRHVLAEDGASQKKVFRAEGKEGRAPWA